ncbi:hypothetical protein NPS40_24530, partial [Escherichia coli]|uniref:hypothetical protein n=1 Tax=Escherichia coli TaxID=562 RepID=UPI002113C6F0
MFVDVEWVSRITARNALIRQNFTAFIVTTQNNIKQREKDKKKGTVAKLAMRQPFVLFKGLTFQKLC